MYKKQLKSNYFENIADIDVLKWKEPQTAKQYKDYKDDLNWSDGILVDQKLNGIRCIITSKGAFSRTNEQFFAIPHILEELKDFFVENPNAYLDGELYNPKHVNELNKIAELVSVVRKQKDVDETLLQKTKNIVEYHIYDGYNFSTVTENSSNKDRREQLTKKFANFNFVKLIKYWTVYSEENLLKLFKEYVENEGGEGLILRNPEGKYEHKRSKNLLKFKKMEDAEFEIVELLEGNGNWANCAKAALCKIENGKTFKTNLEGTQEFLAQAWKNRKEYAGKKITVRFQEYSPYGIPLIPYSDLVVRNYE